MDPDGVVRLVGAILRGTRSLPGAACRGRYGLFNEVVREDVALRQARLRAAVTLCRTCPARRARQRRAAVLGEDAKRRQVDHGGTAPGRPSTSPT